MVNNYNVGPPFDSVQLVRLQLQFHYGFWYANNYSYGGL